MSHGQYLWGLSTGIVVLGIGGAFWLGAGLGPAAADHGLNTLIPLVVAGQIAGLVGFFRVAMRVRQRSGFKRSDLNRSDPETRRLLVGFLWAAALELVLVAAAVLTSLRLERPDLLWPAIGLALSLHFVPIGRLFRVPAYYATAVTGAAVSLVGLFAPLGPWRLAWMGAAMTPVMWGTAAYVAIRADQVAAAAVAPTPRV